MVSAEGWHFADGETLVAQRLSDFRAELGESPVWSTGEQAIWWVDITGKRLLRTYLGGPTVIWETPELAGFVERVGETIYVGMERGIYRFDPDDGQFALVAPITGAGLRFNDACQDDHGRIWAGTMDVENTRRIGVLYHFDPATGGLVPRLDGFLTINGLAWDARKGRLYLSDSHPEVQTVWTLNGEGKAKDFAAFHALRGRPDGAALDAEGRYWIAGVGGGALYRFDPDARLCTRFAVPLEAPTKMVFLDAECREMAVTSKGDDGSGGRLCRIILPDSV